ncbi:hypothetical protein QWJ34_25590 [Saccharibacillus sp. CPCC 101409]|uniref:hypothetical protein n=1 Tax=Saccharibacillus sp. CPCC 101409 TaxID=3058041 RepID=UPI00267396B8|nr:hypothetical protein [Saccharibacillus sp. CPCC 101409]MDO3413151.1 hypothetical protein [Saccharibacillus sp. CPCC 101409]
MGVKHGRDYGEILQDLTKAVSLIEDSYLFFEMEAEDWERLGPEDRLEVHEALAEDLFYALGTQPSIDVGSAVVIHDPALHRINILIGEKQMTFVPLV